MAEHHMRSEPRYPLWYAKRKECGEFVEKSFPWKATNGHVCSDFKTEKEAQKFADSRNENNHG